MNRFPQGTGMKVVSKSGKLGTAEKQEEKQKVIWYIVYFRKKAENAFTGGSIFECIYKVHIYYEQGTLVDTMGHTNLN